MRSSLFVSKPHAPSSGGAATTPISRTKCLNGVPKPYSDGLLGNKIVSVTWNCHSEHLGEGATGNVESVTATLDRGGNGTATLALKSYASMIPFMKEVVALAALGQGKRDWSHDFREHSSSVMLGEQVIVDGTQCKLLTLAANRSNLRRLLPVIYDRYSLGRNTPEIATMFSDMLWGVRLAAASGVCHGDIKCNNIVNVEVSGRIGGSVECGPRLALVDFASSSLFTSDTVHGPTTLLRRRPVCTRTTDSPAFPVCDGKNPLWGDAYAVGLCCLAVLKGDEETTAGSQFFKRGGSEATFTLAHAETKIMVCQKLGGTGYAADGVTELSDEEYEDTVIAALLMSAPQLLLKLARAVDAGGPEGEKAVNDTYQALRVIASLVNPRDQFRASNAVYAEDMVDPIERALSMPFFSCIRT